MFILAMLPLKKIKTILPYTTNYKFDHSMFVYPVSENEVLSVIKDMKNKNHQMQNTRIFLDY